MLGKPEWFQRRKYTGWGLTPKTWQGWVYVLAIILPIVAMQYFFPDNWKVPATLIWAGIFCIDIIYMMITFKQDERERGHEAIAERNAAWTMVVVIAIGVAYEAGVSAVNGVFAVDPFLIGAIICGLFVKMGSNIYLERTA
jgi:hypothetical protein